MAISFVASSALAVINGAAIILTHGSSTANDVAIVYNVSNLADVGTVTLSNGTAFTKLGATVTNSTVSVTVWYRVLVANETTCTASGNSSANSGHAAAVIVLRGAMSPITIASNSTTGTSSTPNPPALFVPQTNDVVIAAMG